MGWSSVSPDRGYFYFVHSYYPVLDGNQEGKWDLLKSSYGEEFLSGLEGPDFLSVQFHPEKSGTEGRRLLTAFLSRVQKSEGP